MGSIVAEIAEKLSATAAGTEQTGTLTIGEGNLVLGSTAVSATAAELNVMDGVTTTAAALNTVTTNYHKVPTFANDAARNSAISSPVVGMLIYNTGAGAVQQYNGVWSTIAPAPSIEGVSGFLNEDTDSTLTVHGANFTVSSILKLFDATSGGSQVGSNATTTFVSATVLKGVFGGAGVPVAGNSVYVEVDNVGATARFATALTVNADPTIVHAGATGTGSNTTTHLGTYGGAGTGGGGDSQTKLLLNFDKSGGTDIEDSSNTGGDGIKMTVVADAKIKSSPFGDGKTAMFFDGSNDYITVTGTTATTKASGTNGTNGSDWTVDFWANYGGGASGNGLGDMRGNGSMLAGWAIYGTSTLNFDYVPHNGTWRQGPSIGTNKINIWTHYAVVQNSSGIHTYQNGKWIASDVQMKGDNTQAWGDLVLGASQSASITRYTSCYLDEYRISNSDRTADSSDQMYTGLLSKGVFATPTTRYTVDSNCKMLVRSNQSSAGAISATADANGEHPTLTVAGAVHSVAQSAIAPALAFPASGKAFGSAGLYLDGTGDQLTAPATSDFDFGTANFTLECWVYPTVNQTYHAGIIGQNNDQNNQYNLICNSNTTTNNRVRWLTHSGVDMISSNALSLNTWHHIAAVRNGSAANLYIDGVSRASGTFNSTAMVVGLTNTFFRVGARIWSGNAYHYQGYIDQVRVSKGIARWTSNFNTDLPTTLYGANLTQVIPTITLTGSATQLAADEDIEFTSVVNPTLPATTQHLTDTGIGLALTNLTGGDKNKATLTGTVGLAGGTTRTGMAIKAQVRKTLGDAAYNNSTLVTFSGSTTTAGLAPGMPLTGTGISVAGPLTCGLQSSTTVTAASTTGLVVGMQVNAFTGVPAGATIVSIIANTSFVISAAATATDADAKLTFNTIISAVPSSTTLTLSNVTTGGNLSSQTLIFEDLTRVHHVNGSEVLNGSQAMLTIATGVSSDPVLFNARRYVGTGAVRSITGYGFQPDFLWIKNRGAVNNHFLVDSVRGAGKRLQSNTTIAAGSQDLTLHSGFHSDGFGLGTSTSNNANANNNNYVAWGWKAGTAYTPTASAYNSPTASINVAGGFGIYKVTANSTASGSPISHGLGVAPDMIFGKALANAYNWDVYFRGATSTSNRLILNSANPVGAGAAYPTTPTSTNFYTAGNSHHGTGDQIFYVWAAKAGVSAFGTYEGNGGGGAGENTSNGINSLGFRPKFVCVKVIESGRTGPWVTLDNFREDTPGGEMIARLYFNTDAAEANGSTAGVTPTSTGFKFSTSATWDGVNYAGATYIYMAFA